MFPAAKRVKYANVYGTLHPARIEIDRIHSLYHTPPTYIRDDSGTPVDRRRQSKSRSVVLEEYTREGLLALWELCKTNYDEVPTVNAYDPEEKCWIWRTVKRKGKGGGHDMSIPPFSDEHDYGVLQRGHGRAKLKVIQLAVYSREEAMVPHGSNTSHLCHTPRCVNPAHLIVETCGRNNRRVCCPCWTYVPGTTTKQHICHHDPPCLRPDEKGMQDKGRVHAPHVPRGWKVLEHGVIQVD